MTPPTVASLVPLVRTWVPGLPQPKGSTSVIMPGGHPRIIASNANSLRRWTDQLVRQLSGRVTEPYREAVTVRLEFRVDRPTSHFKVNREGRQLRADAPPRPHKRPPAGKGGGDLDKLMRAVWDALVTAGVLADDSQVVSTNDDKLYTTPWLEYAPDWQRRPGVVIKVQPL